MLGLGALATSGNPSGLLLTDSGSVDFRFDASVTGGTFPFQFVVGLLDGTTTSPGGQISLFDFKVSVWGVTQFDQQWTNTSAASIASWFNDMVITLAANAQGTQYDLAVSYVLTTGTASFGTDFVVGTIPVITAVDVPEPATLGLFAMGLAALNAVRRRHGRPRDRSKQ